MAIRLGKQRIGIGMLLTIACSVVAVVVLRANASTTSFSSSPLGPRAKATASARLRSVAPAAGFHRYELWRVGSSPRGPAVSCSPAPAACFASGSIQPLSSVSAGALLARFGVRVARVMCPQPGTGLPLESCEAYGSVGRQEVAILVNVMHPRFPDLRSGTQVILFATR